MGQETENTLRAFYDDRDLKTELVEIINSEPILTVSARDISIEVGVIRNDDITSTATSLETTDDSIRDFIKRSDDNSFGIIVLIFVSIITICICGVVIICIVNGRKD